MNFWSGGESDCWSDAEKEYWNFGILEKRSMKFY